MSEQKTVARAIFFDQHNIMHDHDKHWREADQGIWLSAADAALAAMNKREPITDSGWRPITEAPKDGTRLLLWVVHQSAQYSKDQIGEGWAGAVVGEWTSFNQGGWTWHGHLGEVTLWQPLPPPPDGGPGK